jgi:fructokinase
MTKYFAVIEGGGTKFNCAIVDAQKHICAECRVATSTPDATLGAVVDFFESQKNKGFDFEKLGLACFGPLDLNKHSSSFGSITSTPKPHWSNTRIVPILAQALDCDVAVDTDVNAAALAEHLWGVSKDAEVNVYITVGTGLGVGVVINGKPLHGLIHPEIGHMLVSGLDNIQGICEFHGQCFEGLASGKAMSEIWQQPAETLPDDHQAWDIQAQVLGQLCHNLMLSFSPQSIVLGGGVMAKSGLLERVIYYAEKSLNSYVVFPEEHGLEQILSKPGLGEHSGLLGALALVL